MESNPLRGLFGVSSPRLVEKRVSPQPTEPTENVYFEIPSGMIEKLLANPFTHDGTLHPDLHLIYVDEVCRLFKLASMPDVGGKNPRQATEPGSFSKAMGPTLP